jgi:hypothetical protein
MKFSKDMASQSMIDAVNKIMSESRDDDNDDGWYTHNEIHGSKGISAADWRKGIRLNSKGERVDTSKKKEVKESKDIQELSVKTLKSYVKKASPHAMGYGWKGDKNTPQKDADKAFSRSTNVSKAHQEIEDKENPVTNPKIHDLSDMDYDGSVYDYTQTHDEIRDGDVIKMKGGRAAVMYKAWPTMAKGDSKQLHNLSKGMTFDKLSRGRYKKSYEVAQTVKEDTDIQELSTKTLQSYSKGARLDHFNSSSARSEYSKARYSGSRNPPPDDDRMRGIEDRLSFRLKKREKGLRMAKDKLAKKNVKEDTDIQELSKTTLKTYSDKAVQDAKHLYVKMQSGMNDGRTNWRKMNNRHDGIDTAKKKISEDTMDKEDIQEISKKTLKSYVKKSAFNMAVHMQGYGENGAKSNLETAKKREKGIRKAVDKLAEDSKNCKTDRVIDKIKNRGKTATGSSADEVTVKESINESRKYVEAYGKDGKQILGNLDGQTVYGDVNHKKTQHYKRLKAGEFRGKTNSGEHKVDHYKIVDERGGHIETIRFNNVKEENLQELSKKTLKSYVRKATTSEYRLGKKGDSEEDKSMATDGMKYPEKQKRHMDNAGKLFHKQSNRWDGIERAKKKLSEMNFAVIDDYERHEAKRKIDTPKKKVVAKKKKKHWWNFS